MDVIFLSVSLRAVSNPELVQLLLVIFCLYDNKSIIYVYTSRLKVYLKIREKKHD